METRKKKFKNAYLCWFSENRQKIAAEHPHMTHQEITREAGTIWKNLSPAERAPYEEKEREERELFRQSDLPCTYKKRHSVGDLAEPVIEDEEGELRALLCPELSIEAIKSFLQEGNCRLRLQSLPEKL